MSISSKLRVRIGVGVRLLSTMSACTMGARMGGVTGAAGEGGAVKEAIEEDLDRCSPALLLFFPSPAPVSARLVGGASRSISVSWYPRVSTHCVISPKEDVIKWSYVTSYPFSEGGDVVVQLDVQFCLCLFLSTRSCCSYSVRMFWSAMSVRARLTFGIAFHGDFVGFVGFGGGVRCSFCRCLGDDAVHFRLICLPCRLFDRFYHTVDSGFNLGVYSSGHIPDEL
jgi:hypothetical protein